ncbi:MAG: hypothetical protein JNL12_02490 [Planctomycetes bacterium]|nr:hypothetical protein [Planctomycetota bacterium]
MNSTPPSATPVGAPSRSRKLLFPLAIAGFAAAVVAVLLVQNRGPEPTQASPSQDTTANAAAPLTQPRRRTQLALLHAERFKVQKPYQHLWRADRPWVDSGWILVLQTDPELLRPRQVKESVLYVGAQTAERINHGTSGRVVVLVPGDQALASAPIFLGEAALPEELLQTHIDAQLAAAVAAGAIPTPAETVQQVTVPGKPAFETDYELRQRAIDLVEIHSPQEKALIEGWRVPRLR